jgi:hypothetical protein
MSLTTTIAASIRAQLVGTSDHGSPASDELLAYSKSLLTGTGSSQADKVFSDQRTIVASSSETLDLTALTDPFGVTLTFAKVKAILIVASANNTNDVVIGNAASNPFLGPLAGTTPTITLKPGGAVLLTAPVGGWTVTDSSTDNLKVANSSSGSSVVYDVVIIGTSA